MGMAVQGDNVVVPPPMKLEKMLCMKGGYGKSSYAKNSQAQARHARSMLHLLEAALDSVRLPSSDHKQQQQQLPFAVADLGCSCGANTLFIVDAIVNHVAKRYEALGRPLPDFQAFFSDLPSNDFNVLFHLLPPLHSPTLEDCLSRPAPSTTHHPRSRSYFAAGVPGSFYRRLFPARSIDVFHSAFSLHWLSQVPEAVADRRSGAYNAGRVFVHGAPEGVAAAYRGQFKADLEGFLRCRAEEVRPGGSMFLVCLGRASPDPVDQGGAGLMFGSHFEDSWEDLVHEGLIEAEKRDAFNIPVYAPSLQEFREVVKANGSFTINQLELVRGGSPLVLNRPDDPTPAEVGSALANSCRSVCGVLVEAHIGDRLGDELFSRLERRGTTHAWELMEHMQFFHIVASLSFA